MTAQLVTDALLMAVWRHGKPDALLHYLDQVGQYTRRAVPAPDGRPRHRLQHEPLGKCWDNAAMESFFSSLKTKWTANKIYRTRDEARADVFDYIERFCNTTRRHSTIGYLSPVEFERKVGLA